jgi:hypothetical protein
MRRDRQQAGVVAFDRVGQSTVPDHQPATFRTASLPVPLATRGVLCTVCRPAARDIGRNPHLGLTRYLAFA